MICLLAEKGDTKPVNRKVFVHGLPVTIEHPRHTTRILHDAKGNVVYKRFMYHHYGYFDGTKGRDGDAVDCFLGPLANAKEVHVVRMVDKGPVPSEREDEDKCMVGFPSADAAKQAFLQHYPADFYGGMVSLPVAEFKERLRTASLPFHTRKIHAGKS